ncbi:MAG: hypothetical protein M3065_21680 [Actinomycetota bacterium]|nr:hypothetical protein [Actinomycetota bacterium]
MTEGWDAALWVGGESLESGEDHPRGAEHAGHRPGAIDADAEGARRLVARAGGYGRPFARGAGDLGAL